MTQPINHQYRPSRADCYKLCRAGTRLLDGYQAERRPVAEEVLGATSGLTGLVLGESPAARLVRDRVLFPLMGLRPAEKLIWEQASQLKTSYARSPFGQRPRAGDRVPEFAATDRFGWTLTSPRDEDCAAAARDALGDVRHAWNGNGPTHRMLASLPAAPRRTRRILLDRDSGRNFSERDRLVVQLLRPHLYEVYLDAQRRLNSIPRLSNRKLQVLHLAAQGRSNADIAGNCSSPSAPYANTWNTSSTAPAPVTGRRQPLW